MARKGEAHVLRITHLRSGKKPKCSEKRLGEILAGFPTIHRGVVKRGGNWGDVMRAVNKEFGTRLGVQHMLWLNWESKRRRG